MNGWIADQIPDLRGKRALVTGANSGIGWHTALELARAGAWVLLACRDQGRGTEAVARLRAQVPQAQVELGLLDLADLASVRAFAEPLADHPLDILVNNAAVMRPPQRQLTRDGFELQLGVTHLGHFALTGWLLKALLRGSSRVVTVSSLAHLRARMDFDDLQGEHRYSPGGAYAQSKLANLLFTLQFDRLAGKRLLSLAAHPGISATNLFHAGRALGGPPPGLGLRLGLKLVAQSAARGALPSLYAATAPQVTAGGYYGPDGPWEVWGAHPRTARTSPQARDPQAAERLWALSEQLTGVRYGDLGL